MLLVYLLAATCAIFTNGEDDIIHVVLTTNGINDNGAENLIRSVMDIIINLFPKKKKQ